MYLTNPFYEELNIKNTGEMIFNNKNADITIKIFFMLLKIFIELTPALYKLGGNFEISYI